MYDENKKEIARKLHIRDTRIAPEIMELCIFLITNGDIGDRTRGLPLAKRA
jgi:hypothetical protein